MSQQSDQPQERPEKELTEDQRDFRRRLSRIFFGLAAGVAVIGVVTWLTLAVATHRNILALDALGGRFLAVSIGLAVIGLYPYLRSRGNTRFLCFVVLGGGAIVVAAVVIPILLATGVIDL